MPSLTMDIRHGSELEKTILGAIRDRIQYSRTKMSNFHSKWKEAEDMTVAYLPERETDAKRRVEREAGKPQYTTLVLPYTYGMLLSAHTYWTTVFMSRTPVFQFTGRHGETAQQEQAVEALIGYQVDVGQMLIPLYIWLYDVGKYGLGVVCNYWDEEQRIVSRIIEQEEFMFGMIPTGRMRKQKITERIPGYEGNKLVNIRPYDFFPDPRVPLHRFHQGEFCGIYFELGWGQVLARSDAGYYTNLEFLDKAVNTEGGGAGSDTDDVGSTALERPETSSPSFTDPTSRRPQEMLKGYECYIDLIPSKWGLGSSTQMEKWVFTCDKHYKVLVGAQPLGAYHDRFPFFVLEYETEGYALGNRGLPELLEPIQRTMDWLINTHFYNVRKTLNNQFVVDPSRIVMKDLMDPGPGGMYRLRPEAYGTDTRLALTQLSVQDVTQNHLRDISMMLEVGQRATGINEAIMGSLAPKGRRTATEVRTSSTFGINRLKTQAEYYSAMGWGPLAQTMLQNTQQYYSGEKKFRIVGDLAQEAGDKFLTIGPDQIAGFFDMVPVDGTLPIDRFAQANLWKELMAQLRVFPQVTVQYDVGRIFAWVAQLAGLKNINQFKIKIMAPESIAAATAAGNLIPMPGGKSGAPVRAKQGLTNIAEPAQLPMMGPTG